MKQKSRKNVCLKDLNLINIEKFLFFFPPNKKITLENEMEEKNQICAFHVEKLTLPDSPIFSAKQKGEQYQHNPLKHSILINLFFFLMDFFPTNFNKLIGT